MCPASSQRVESCLKLSHLRSIKLFQGCQRCTILYDHNHIYIDICILTYDWLRSTRIDCSSILLAILTSWCVLDGSTGWWLPWLWKEGENDWYRSFKEKGSRRWLMTTTMKSNNDVDHVISCHFQPPHRKGSRMVSPWTQATSGWWKGMLCHYLLVSQLPAGWHHVFLKDSCSSRTQPPVLKDSARSASFRAHGVKNRGSGQERGHCFLGKNDLGSEVHLDLTWSDYDSEGWNGCWVLRTIIPLNWGILHVLNFLLVDETYHWIGSSGRLRTQNGWQRFSWEAQPPWDGL